MPTISDLFHMQYGHSLELNRLEQSNGNGSINFVGRAARNNGVTARVTGISGLTPAAGGTISVALGGQGGAGVAFLQPRPYYCGRDVMILTAKKSMTENEKLWWVLCITSNRFRFGFGRQANRTLPGLVLPDSETMPKWVPLTPVDRFSGAEARKLSEAVILPKADKWKLFRLGDLFRVSKGRRLTKAQMLPGLTPFIGAVDNNNGVTAFVAQESLHEGNTITVNYNGNGVAEAFYQPTPYRCSDDVNVLYPLFPVTPAIGLFVATVIRLEKYRFSYGRKWHAERMSQSQIKLPVDLSDSPDWELMQRCIESLPYSSQI